MLVVGSRKKVVDDDSVRDRGASVLVQVECRSARTNVAD
jgi:hypothetical protein